MTSFDDVYRVFLSKITDDMYMELTPEDTTKLLKDLLINSLHFFEFPRKNLYDYDEDAQYFMADLDMEEINVIATYMMVEWLGQQLDSVEMTRMKYSGSDFKFTSQANHMQKLLQLKKDNERLGFHLQRLYKRRKSNKDGIMKSTFGNIMKPIEEVD